MGNRRGQIGCVIFLIIAAVVALLPVIGGVWIFYRICRSILNYNPEEKLGPDEQNPKTK